MHACLENDLVPFVKYLLSPSLSLSQTYYHIIQSNFSWDVYELVTSLCQGLCPFRIPLWWVWSKLLIQTLVGTQKHV